MNFINRKFHALMDYVAGLLLIASPWLFNFNEITEARWAAVAVGTVILLTSLMTDYEGGVVKVFSMSTHLTTDVLSGLFLAASPWIFNFSDQIYLPHLLLGLMEMGVAIFTERTSYYVRGTRLNRDLTHAH